MHMVDFSHQHCTYVKNWNEVKYCPLCLVQVGKGMFLLLVVEVGMEAQGGILNLKPIPCIYLLLPLQECIVIVQTISEHRLHPLMGVIITPMHTIN